MDKTISQSIMGASVFQYESTEGRKEVYCEKVLTSKEACDQVLIILRKNIKKCR